MSDVLTCIAGSQLAATQSSVTRPLSTTVKPNIPGVVVGNIRTHGLVNDFDCAPSTSRCTFAERHFQSALLSESVPDAKTVKHQIVTKTLQNHTCMRVMRKITAHAD